MLINTTDCSIFPINLLENFQQYKTNINWMRLNYSKTCCSGENIEKIKYYSDITANFTGISDYDCNAGSECSGKNFSVSFDITNNITSPATASISFISDNVNLQSNYTTSVSNLNASDEIDFIGQCASGKYTITLYYNQSSIDFTTVLTFITTGTSDCTPVFTNPIEITQSTVIDTFSINSENEVFDLDLTSEGVYNFTLTVNYNVGEETATLIEKKCGFLDCKFGCNVASYVNNHFEENNTNGIAAFYFLIYSAVSCNDCCTACELYEKTKSLILNECNC